MYSVKNATHCRIYLVPPAKMPHTFMRAVRTGKGTVIAHEDPMSHDLL